MRTVNTRDLVKLARDNKTSREDMREALQEDQDEAQEVDNEEKQVAVLESMKEAMDRTTDIVAAGVSVQKESGDKLARLLSHMLTEFSKKAPHITEWIFDIERDKNDRPQRIIARATRCGE